MRVPIEAAFYGGGLLAGRALGGNSWWLVIAVALAAAVGMFAAEWLISRGYA